MNSSCVIILGIPCSGETLLGKALMSLGYFAEGTTADPSGDWSVVAINQTICDSGQKPKMDSSLARYAYGSLDYYVEQKVKEGKPWIINEPRMCMTLCEYVPFLKKHNVDYKVISIMRSPHHSAFDLVKADRSMKLENVSELLGRYLIARSMSVEMFLLMDKEHKSKLIYISSDEMLDKPDQEVDSLVKLIGLEVTDEQRLEAIKAIKPSFELPQPS